MQPSRIPWKTETKDYGPVDLPYPGRRARKIAKTTLVSALILLTVLGSISPLIPDMVKALFDNQPPPSDSQASDQTGPQVPRSASAGPVPDLSLPRTVLSDVETMIGSGGVLRNSSENLTLYNSNLSVELLGGTDPHDELLGLNHENLGSSLIWKVEVQNGAVWIPLPASSSNMTVLGTDSTGTSVKRMSTVANGNITGIFTIIYHATSTGQLKWDLTFTPSRAAHYRFVYEWRNVLAPPSNKSQGKQFQSDFPKDNFTFSWNDIPLTYNTTAFTQGRSFFLSIDLGSVKASSSIAIDPNIVSSNVAAGATAYTFQRKVFYDPVGRNYWVFYYDGFSVKYRYSSDGANWSSALANYPSTLIDYSSGSPAYLVGVFVYGSSIIIAAGRQISYSGSGSTNIHYSLGTVSGTTINWGPDSTGGASYGPTCQSGTCTVGVRYPSVITTQLALLQVDVLAGLSRPNQDSG